MLSLILAFILAFPTFWLIKEFLKDLVEEFGGFKKFEKNLAAILFLLSFLVLLAPLSNISFSYLFRVSNLSQLGNVLLSVEISAVLLFFIFLLEFFIFDKLFYDVKAVIEIKRDNIALSLLFLATSYIVSLMLLPFISTIFFYIV